MQDRRTNYRFESNGFAFLLDSENVGRLKGMADFETQEEPALAEQFLRLRAEEWAEALTDAGASPADIAVRVDPHQRKAHLVKGSAVIVSADI